ncbi:hypothetical protein JMJ35_009414 [Cladonia borealis]|uniref:Uncharacterized protein n=1 Tax=Cladonia borealis TaxID=184061 RepID=A0AA39QSG2_9LECA|nr:hypothetical protein JMJ35_009414 [Cladonia borealis]
MPYNNKSPSLTGAALARLANPPKSQCSTWAEKPETHEQVAVGQETSRSTKKTKKFLKDIEKSIKGDTARTARI